MCLCMRLLKLASDLDARQLQSSWVMHTCVTGQLSVWWAAVWAASGTFLSSSMGSLEELFELSGSWVVFIGKLLGL